MVTLFVRPAKIRAAAGSLKYYGHVPLGEREITIVSSWTRWIHKSELVLAGKVPIGLTYIRLEMTVDRAWHSLRTLISSRMLKLFQTAFLRFELPLSLWSAPRVYMYMYIGRDTTFIPLFPGLTSTSPLDDSTRVGRNPLRIEHVRHDCFIM